jgi:hypothetical protein
MKNLEKGHDIPCAYCERTPTWPVTWHVEGKDDTIYLCAECDESETNAIDWAHPMTYDEIMKEAIDKHASNVTGHEAGCSCKACCEVRVRSKRQLRGMK